MPEQPVDLQGEQMPGEPEPQVAIEESKRSLLQRFKSRIPHTKEFENWLKEYQEKVNAQRLDKYRNLSALKDGLKEELQSNFAWSGQQVSEIESWTEMAMFWVRFISLTATSLLLVAAPPLASKFLPLLVGWDRRGFWWLPLELSLSVITAALAFVVFSLVFLVFPSVSSKAGRFLNSNAIIGLWGVLLTLCAAAYVYALRAGKLPWSLPAFRHRIGSYIIIQAGLVLPFAYGTALVVAVFKNNFENQKRRLLTREVVADELLNILDMIEQADYESSLWPGLLNRSFVTERLEIVASCIENYLPSNFVTGVPEMDRWTQQSASEMANGVRAITKSIIAPTGYSLQSLRARITNYFAAGLAGEWGKFERVPAEKLSRKQGFKERVASVVTALVTAAVPILLLLILKRLGVVLVEPLLTYLTVGAYTWAALSLLSRLDPQYAAKLGALKDITKTLPFGKKGGDDG